MSGRLLVFGSAEPRTDEIPVTGSSGQAANPDALERVLEALLEPGGRDARRRAVDAIKAEVRSRTHPAESEGP